MLNIPHRERIIYRKSFLHSVNMYFGLSRPIDENKTKDLVTLLENNEWNKNEEVSIGIFFLRKNNSTCVIAEKAIALVISHTDYQNLDVWKDFFISIENCFGDISVSDIVIQKTNRYCIKSADSPGDENIKEYLLSQEYRDAVVNSVESNTVISQPKENVHLMLKYNLTTDSDLHTLELVVAAMFHNTLSSFVEGLKCANEVVYDMWRWGISNNVIEMMGGEE